LTTNGVSAEQSPNTGDPIQKVFDLALDVGDEEAPARAGLPLKFYQLGQPFFAKSISPPIANAPIARNSPKKIVLIFSFPVEQRESGSRLKVWLPPNIRT
jgi:hypothetical protein